jgi:predicted MFS family arabinose efflux permease
MLVGIGVTDLTFRTSQVALPLVVLGVTGSPAATGLVGGASGIPVLVSPWWTRRLRHHVRTGRAISVCYLIEAFALGTVAMGATAGRLNPMLLVIAGLVLGCAEALDGPGRDALVADLGDRIGDDQALTLLTVRDFFRRVSMVAGPALGGILVARGLAVPLLWAEVMSILVSAGLTVGIGSAGPRRDDHWAQSIWAVVRRRPQVLRGWVVRGTGCALWFAFTVGLVVLGEEQGRGGLFLAVGMTAYGVGSVLGTLGVIRVLRVLPVLPTIAAAWAVTGLCWWVMGAVATTPAIAIAAFVSGLAVVVGNVGVTAQITRGTRGAERRTLMAGQSVVVNAASSLGLLLGGPLLALIGPRSTLELAGTTAVAVATVCLVGVRRDSGVASGDVRGARSVPAAEEAGVHEQRVELVDADAVGPAVGER